MPSGLQARDEVTTTATESGACITADGPRRWLATKPIPHLRIGTVHCWNSYFLFPPKLNKSVRSPRAGLFDGAYGSVTLGIGLGRLSRLRSVIGGSAQLYSMNFKIETWSLYWCEMCPAEV